MDFILDVILERAISVANGEAIVLPVRKSEVVDFYFYDAKEVEIQEFDNFLIHTDLNQLAGDISNIIQSVKKGVTPPLEILVKCKAIADVMDLIRDEILDISIDEVRKYGKEGANVLGAKVSVIESGVKWDFSECQTALLDIAMQKEKEAKEEVKRVQDILKFMGEKGLNEMLIDNETGEMITMQKPPIKSSKTTTKVELPKLKTNKTKAKSLPENAEMQILDKDGKIIK